MTIDTFPRLLGDIGGTNARFGWQTGPGTAPSDIATYACADHASLLDAIRHDLAGRRDAAPRACAIGIANPVTGDQVRMTNHHWSFSIAALRRDLGVERLAVVNDFTALAWSLPDLGASDLHAIGRGQAVPAAPMAVLGPGTGLGVSGLLPDGRGGHVPLTGEGGHVTLAATDAREEAVLAQLRARFGHASAERALSGPGLVNLYTAVCAIVGRTAQPLAPAEVIAQARDGGDPSCAEALDLFFSFLGNVAGNLALTIGARGGVYVGGGIVPRLLAELERSAFRDHFEGKGRFGGYLSEMPTRVITAAGAPALLGASRALDAGT